MTTIATAHCPLITEASIADAFRIVRELPTMAVPTAPDQVMLEAILDHAPTLVAPPS